MKRYATLALVLPLAAIFASGVSAGNHPHVTWSPGVASITLAAKYHTAYQAWQCIGQGAAQPVRLAVHAGAVARALPLTSTYASFVCQGPHGKRVSLDAS